MSKDAQSDGMSSATPSGDADSGDPITGTTAVGDGMPTGTAAGPVDGVSEGRSDGTTEKASEIMSGGVWDGTSDG